MDNQRPEINESFEKNEKIERSGKSENFDKTFLDKKTKPSMVKKAQQRNLIIGTLVVISLLGGVSWLISSNNPTPPRKDKVETVSMESPLSRVDAQSVWVERTQNELAKEEKVNQTTTDELKQMSETKEKDEKNEQAEAAKIASLESRLNNLQTTLEGAHGNGQGNGGSLFPPGPNQGGAQGNQGFSGGDTYISDDSLALTPQKSSDQMIATKNPKTYVPAGTFARAIMLGGADASAGVTGQGDPSPMLFRILDKGVLPNHQFSSLKNCVATAATYGDISSERGEIRLERLSCTRPDGQIIDLPVEGTAFGPDGKNGVRGIPVWREGALLERAFLAGTLSGFSNGISQAYTTNNLSPFGTTSTVDNGKIAQYGLASGFGNAAEKLADYNIKRAEQYHPVIQISAGTEVDLLFLKGFYLDGKKHDKDDEPVFTDVSSSTASDLSSQNTQGNSSSLPLTPQQIQALKSKDAKQGYFN